jgi:hypothetical protein
MIILSTQQKFQSKKRKGGVTIPKTEYAVLSTTLVLNLEVIFIFKKVLSKKLIIYFF